MSIALNNDGEIIQSVNFGLNSEKIKEKAKNDNEYLSFLSNLIENVSKLRSEFLFTIALSYAENPIEEYKINQGVSLSNTCYFSSSDSVGFSIKFSSIDCWRFYHEIGGKQEEPSVQNVLIKKTSSSSEFVFSLKASEGMTVGERYKNLFISSANGLSFEQNMNDYHPDFVFFYSSPFQKLRSNANIKFSNSGANYHVWKFEEESLKQSHEIEIWYNQINYGLWYVLVLVSVLLPTACILAIFHFKNKKKRKVN